MALDKNTLAGGILLVALYIVVAQPFATTMATFGISVLLFAVTKSEAIVLAFMLASLFVRHINRLFIPSAPVGIEGFQARDAESVHARIKAVENKPEAAVNMVPIPGSPHMIDNITGVLESPHILDNTPLMAMDGADGVPGASIPASSKARVLIHPMAEGFQNTPNMSVYGNPIANPVLQYGEDEEAVNTAMLDEGTDIVGGVPSSNMASV
jgi:hypothetical protein